MRRLRRGKSFPRGFEARRAFADQAAGFRNAIVELVVFRWINVVDAAGEDGDSAGRKGGAVSGTINATGQT